MSDTPRWFLCRTIACTRATASLAVTLGAGLGVVAIGAVDYLTGFELRVFPLYFVPISIAAWWAGRSPALMIAAASTVAWMASNQLATVRSPLWIDVINAMMQLGSFALVAALISGLRRAYSSERKHSRTDALTGLLNTRGFFEEAPRLLALARRHGYALTAAYVDLDDFKLVNDSGGHAEGDQVLRLAAHAIRSELRGADLAARIGGDEFVLLLPHTNEAGARCALRRLHEHLQGALRRRYPQTGASMGAAVFTRPPPDLDRIVRQADEVMYSVKAAGRGRVAIVSIAADAVHEDGDGASLVVMRRDRRETSARHRSAVPSPERHDISAVP